MSANVVQHTQRRNSAEEPAGDTAGSDDSEESTGDDSSQPLTCSSHDLKGFQIPEAVSLASEDDPHDPEPGSITPGAAPNVPAEQGDPETANASEDIASECSCLLWRSFDLGLGRYRSVGGDAREPEKAKEKKRLRGLKTRRRGCASTQGFYSCSVLTLCVIHRSEH